MNNEALDELRLVSAALGLGERQSVQAGELAALVFALRARLASLESAVIDVIAFTGADATRHVRRKCLLCDAVAIDDEPLVHQKCWSNRVDKSHPCPMGETR